MFKIFYADEYGEVHFGQEEFEAILNEVYQAGYEDGKKSITHPIAWSPTTTTYPVTYDVTCTDKDNYKNRPTYTTSTQTECKCGGHK